MNGWKKRGEGNTAANQSSAKREQKMKSTSRTMLLKTAGEEKRGERGEIRGWEESVREGDRDSSCEVILRAEEERGVSGMSEERGR